MADELWMAFSPSTRSTLVNQRVLLLAFAYSFVIYYSHDFSSSSTIIILNTYKIYGVYIYIYSIINQEYRIRINSTHIFVAIVVICICLGSSVL